MALLERPLFHSRQPLSSPTKRFASSKISFVSIANLTNAAMRRAHRKAQRLRKCNCVTISRLVCARSTRTNSCTVSSKPTRSAKNTTSCLMNSTAYAPSMLTFTKNSA